MASEVSRGRELVARVGVAVAAVTAVALLTAQRTDMARQRADLDGARAQLAQGQVVREQLLAQLAQARDDLAKARRQIAQLAGDVGDVGDAVSKLPKKPVVIRPPAQAGTSDAGPAGSAQGRPSSPTTSPDRSATTARCVSLAVARVCP